MSVAFNTAKSRGGRRGRRMMSDINVTPFVDVMLVLLVVFMITAPLLTVGVPVDLPENAAPELPGEDEPLAVSLNAEGVIFLQETEIAIDELGPRLRAITQNNEDARVFVRGDKAIDYGQIMAVMSAISEAGFNHIALITEFPDSEAN